MKIKKTLCLLLAASTIFALSACTGDNSSSSVSSVGTSSNDVSSKPELNILTYYTTFDMHEQPSYAVSEELTGYKINWFNLPQEQPTEKLLLEIAGGTSYDMLVRMSLDQISQLEAKNGLIELTPYLEAYGDAITTAVPEISWTATTDEDGDVFGVPTGSYDTPTTKENLYGVLKGGIGFRSDALKDLNKEVPTTLDEFYDILVAYKAATGNAGLTTTSGAFYSAILSAFGLGDALWYEVDGEFVPRIKTAGMVDYLAFMQKLYKEGLYDADMPINTTTSAKEKFSNGTALCTNLMFWDIPSMIAAVKTSNENCDILFATPLASDSNTKADLYVSQGVGAIMAIPKTAANPEHAMIWLNMLSETETFKTIYIGEENVSYEVKEDNYYPIFDAFNNYTNADKFTGVAAPGVFEMWQARARKTPEMAVAYEDMNSKIADYNVEFYYTAFAAFLEDVMNNEATLNTLVGDAMISAIVDGGDAQAAINAVVAKWDAEGGAEYEAAMKTWYTENKGLFVE